MSATPRRLIINADDFGMSPGVNRGVIRAHEEGVVTAASLMTRAAYAAEATAYARRSRRLSVGLHFDFGEWKCVEGNWLPAYMVTCPDDAAAIEGEATSQLDRFREWLGRNPTHIDSHQHFHRREPYRTVLRRVAAELGIPLREDGAVRYVGAFYGQAEGGAPLEHHIRPYFFLELARTLAPGMTEMSCHPSAAPDTTTPYEHERLIELETLCDRRVREGLAELSITLTAF